MIARAGEAPAVTYSISELSCLFLSSTFETHVTSGHRIAALSSISTTVMLAQLKRCS